MLRHDRIFNQTFASDVLRFSRDFSQFETLDRNSGTESTRDSRDKRQKNLLMKIEFQLGRIKLR